MAPDGPVAVFCDLLQRLVRECRVRQTDIAHLLGKSPSSVSELLNGGRRTPPDWDDVRLIVTLCAERAERRAQPLVDLRLDEGWWRSRHAEVVGAFERRRAARGREASGPCDTPDAVGPPLTRTVLVSAVDNTVARTVARDVRRAIHMDIDEAVQLLSAGRAELPRTAHVLLGEVYGKQGPPDVANALLEGFAERVRAEHGVPRGALLQAARLVLAAAALVESGAQRVNRTTPRQLIRELVSGAARAQVWSDERQQPADPVLLAGAQAVIAAHRQEFVDHYLRLATPLAAVCPEFALTAGLPGAGESTRGGTGLAGLGALLAEFGGLVDPAPSHHVLLHSPIASLDVRGPRVPSLADGYVNPRFRLPGQDLEDGAEHGVASDKWWDEQPLHDGIERFFAAHLLSLPAFLAPLVVLGDPGAGKSLLTKLLTARLPEGDFRPLRVELRRVPAEADVQDQLEHALREARGRSVSWPDWSESEPGAIPVVLLDGFDELLQAGAQRLSVTRQWGYLRDVAAFQAREAELGRPLIVVVTSRTVVADRAEIPRDSQVLRLEPFHEPEIRQWLAIWNTTNRAHLEQHALRPLTLEALGRQDRLAAQPLLLLMLALYDIEGNALQRFGAERLSGTQLYEQLLREFVRRQIEKDGSLPADDEGIAVDRELHRLSVVALGIFQRGAQAITGEEADRDLRALGGTETVERYAERGLLFGRFLFVHEAQAVVTEQRLRSYEFMHATFGEHLTARLIERALRRLTAAPRRGDGLPDDGELYALLSFAPLTDRTRIVQSLREMLSGRESPTARDALTTLLAELFRAAPWDIAHRTDSGHAPVPLTRTYRDAVYTANLLLIAVLTVGAVHASDFLGAEGTAEHWRRQSMMWQSQFSANSWDLYSSTLSPERFWHPAPSDSDGSREDLRIGMDRVPFVHHELSWAHGYQYSRTPRAPGHVLVDGSADELANTVRRVMFVGDPDAEYLLHVAYPLLRQMPSSLRAYHLDDEGQLRSAAQSLVALLTRDLHHPAVLPDLYDRCLTVVGALPQGEMGRYLEAVCRQLVHDVPALTDSALASVLRGIADVPAEVSPSTRDALRACLRQATGRGSRS